MATVELSAELTRLGVAFAEDVDTELAGKATAAQGAKADTAVQPAALTTALSAKADTSALTLGLATKVDKDGVKVLSDNNYTDAEKVLVANAVQPAALASGLSAKVDTSTYTTGLAAKANTSDVTTLLAAKADNSALTSGLAGKVDASTLSATTKATIGSSLVAGANTTVTYDSGTGNTTIASTASGGGALGPYATPVAMQTASPAASNAGKVALVGASAPYIEYYSDGSVWTLKRYDKQQSSLAKGSSLIARATQVTKGRRPVGQFLSQIGTAPAAAYGFVKMLGTATNACRVRRVSDNVEKDIPFAADGVIDTDLLLAFQGTSTLAMTMFYDQVGTNHMTQTDVTLQPFIDTQFFRNGMPGIQGGIKSSIARRMTIPAGVAVTATNNCAVWSAVGTLNGRNSVVPWALGAADVFDMTITAGSVHSASPKISATALNFGNPNYASLAPSNGVVCGLNSATTGMKYYMRDGVFTRAAGAAVGVTGGDWPKSTSSSVEQYALVIFNSSLSDADALILQRLMSRAYGIGMEVSANVVLCGDSIVESAITGNYNYNTTLVHYLPPEITLFNVGVGGQTLQTESTEVGPRVVGFFKAGIPNVAICTGGTNDITLGGVGVSTNMINYLTTWHTATRTAGFKTIHATLYPRAIEGTFTAAKEVERSAFNDYLRSNYGTGRLLDGIVDFELEPDFLPKIKPADFPDNLHPNVTGYAKATPIMFDAIMVQMPGVV